jgi:hypothetical protein
VYTTTRDYSYLAINRALRAFHHEHYSGPQISDQAIS